MPEEIVEMQRSYKTLGIYAAVAKKMGCGASTISKYIQMKNVPQAIKIAVLNLMEKE